MMIAPLPANEETRVKELHQYALLDTLPEVEFDSITRIAANICGTPMALITLVDADRQWFKSKVGVQASESPRSQAFCAHAILEPGVMVVEDATLDERFSDNPLVTSDPKIRFYAGAPLVSPNGSALGTLCVIDRVARELSPEQKTALQSLAELVEKQLEQRRMLVSLSRKVAEGKLAEDELMGTLEETQGQVREKIRTLARVNAALKLQSAERIDAEQAAKRLDLLNRWILNSVGEGFFGLDSEGKVAFVNPAAVKLLGWEAGDLLGKFEHTLWHHTKLDGRPYPREECRIYTACERLTLGHADDEVFWRKDGTSFPVDYVVTPMIDEQGNTSGGVVAFQDITERKRAEDELRRAKDAAEAASRAKSEFLSNISHELRTPMNGILGMTGLLHDTELNLEQIEIVQLLKDSADAMMAVVTDLLNFSSMDRGNLQLEHVDFDLRKALAPEAEKLANDARQKGLAITWSVEPEVPVRLVGDPVSLRHVIRSIVGNAVKFMERGEVKVEVRMEGRDSDKVRLHWVVTDSGIGIPEEKLASIFDAFVQGDGSSTRKYGGTGLGLSVSSQLAELMGGRIWAESKVGVGSTFHFTASFGSAESAKFPSSRAA